MSHDESYLQVFESLQNYIINAVDIENGGTQVIFRFPNNYGASVIKQKASYGVELAAIKFSSDDVQDWKIVYDTPITYGVIGWLVAKSLEDALIQIKSL